MDRETCFRWGNTVFITAFLIAAALFAGAETAFAANGELEAKSFSTGIVSAQSNDANLKAAKAKYRVSDNSVYEVLEGDSVDVIKRRLSTAGANASSSNPFIVHIPAGSYSVDNFNVPQNVILVSESSVKITSNTSRNSLVTVEGVVYGGYYDAAYKAKNGIYLAQESFAGNNGIVEKATVTRAAAQGILAIRETCKNAQAIDCTVTKCKESGISVQGGASYKLIRGCTLNDNNYSGINLSHSDIVTIDKCVIKNNLDKAISTNSDPITGYKQPGCNIGSVTGCYIEGNKTNGVYLKPKCYIQNFTGNTLVNNADGLVCASKTAAGTTGTSYAKNVSNNVFKGNVREQVVAKEKGATVYLGAGNKIINGKRSGLFADKKGVIKITGNNNLIQGNKAAGFSITNSGKLEITGTNTKILSNKGQGIYARGGKVTIKGAKTQISKNKQNGIATYKKSTVSIIGKNLTIASNKANGISVKDKSKLTLKGKGSKIQKNGGYGVYAASKSTATVKNVKYSGNKKGKTAANGGAKVK